MSVDWPAHMRRIIDKLGEDIAFTPAGGGSPVTIRVVFAAPYARLLDDPGIASSAPRIVGMTADFPGGGNGGTFTRSAVNWKTVQPEPDAVGGYTIFQLQKQ